MNIMHNVESRRIYMDVVFILLRNIFSRGFWGVLFVDYHYYYIINSVFVCFGVCIALWKAKAFTFKHSIKHFCYSWRWWWWILLLLILILLLYKSKWFYYWFMQLLKCGCFLDYSIYCMSMTEIYNMYSYIYYISIPISYHARIK